MKIECRGTIGIVSTKQKWYNYKRKGYWVGERWVKPKTIRKYRIVQLKKPYLSGHIELLVEDNLMLGGLYVDENMRHYVCVSKQGYTELPISRLKIVSTDLGETFSPPQLITLNSKPIAER